MIDHFIRRRCVIFIHYGESGRGYNILYAKFFTNGLDEGGLARPHLPIESEYCMVAHLRHKLLGSFPYTLYIIDYDFHLFFIVN